MSCTKKTQTSELKRTVQLTWEEISPRASWNRKRPARPTSYLDPSQDTNVRLLCPTLNRNVSDTGTSFDFIIKILVVNVIKCLLLVKGNRTNGYAGFFTGIRYIMYRKSLFVIDCSGILCDHFLCAPRGTYRLNMYAKLLDIYNLHNFIWKSNHQHDPDLSDLPNCNGHHTDNLPENTI